MHQLKIKLRLFSPSNIHHTPKNPQHSKRVMTSHMNVLMVSFNYAHHIADDDFMVASFEEDNL